MAFPLWYYFLVSFVDTVGSFIWLILPHRYPVAGTRIMVRSRKYRDTWYGDGNVLTFSGTVVGPKYEYRPPYDYWNVEGVYLTGHPHWSPYWIVKLDDEFNTVDEYREEDIEFTSGYRIGWPLFDRLFTPFLWGRHRVSNLPCPVTYFPGDMVTYSKDTSAIPRRVHTVWFDFAGMLTYRLYETRAEYQARLDELNRPERRRGRAMLIDDGGPHPRINAPPDTLMLISRSAEYSERSR